MDRADFVICRRLWLDSRLPYSVLARELDTTVQTIHRRIAALRGSGVIGRFTASLGFRALGAEKLLIEGVTEAPWAMDAVEAVGGIELVDRVILAGGNRIFAFADLPSPSDEDGLLDEMRVLGEMSIDKVGRLASPVPMKPFEDVPPMRSLDFHIVRMLKDDSRRPLNEVAEVLGVTSKTVRRRLAWMRQEGLVDLNMVWYLDRAPEALTLLKIELTHGSDQRQAIPALMKCVGDHVVMPLRFSDHPDSLVIMTWYDTIRDARDAIDVIRSTGLVEALCQEVLTSVSDFPSWRDAMLAKRTV